MQRNHPERDQMASNSNVILNAGATKLLAATVAIIFVAEALVMVFIYLLKLPPDFSTGIIDATLLSLLVAPALYFTFLKPMQEAFFKRNKSEESQKRLEEIDRMKNDFISLAAHELRTPLSTIMGYCELLEQDLTLGQREGYQKIILKEAETLDRLIDDLEIVNQLEVEKNNQLKQTQNDLKATINHACDVCRQKFPELPLKLNLPEAPLLMTYDEVRISQVLENLLSNAAKYSSGHQDLIEVSVTDSQDKVSICVNDQGVGMTQDETENIYNMFYRAETKKAAVGGLGLGMAIVKNIVQNHNGTIEVASQRNVGTQVKVTLPKQIEDHQPEHRLNSDLSEVTNLIHERRIALAM